jgi:membrane fusion protein (multidrug efflux system)
VSQQAYETAKANALLGEADVLGARAALETARLNLSYTKVTSPIAGRIGKALVTEGALVSATEATQMAMVQQLDPIFVDFTQSSAEMLKLRRELGAAKAQEGMKKEFKIVLVLEDGTTYAEAGKLMFADVSVDPNTGTVTVRGEFPNRDKLLLPGMYVRGWVEEPTETEAITVPQRAVSRDAYGAANVLVVNEHDTVEQRGIETGAMLSDRWIVSSGLKAGERVIVEGLQKVRPGAAVKAVPFQGGEVKTQPTAAPAGH